MRDAMNKLGSDSDKINPLVSILFLPYTLLHLYFFELRMGLFSFRKVREFYDLTVCLLMYLHIQF